MRRGSCCQTFKPLIICLQFYPLGDNLFIGKGLAIGFSLIHFLSCLGDHVACDPPILIHYAGDNIDILILIWIQLLKHFPSTVEIVRSWSSGLLHLFLLYEMGFRNDPSFGKLNRFPVISLILFFSRSNSYKCCYSSLKNYSWPFNISTSLLCLFLKLFRATSSTSFCLDAFFRVYRGPLFFIEASGAIYCIEWTCLLKNLCDLCDLTFFLDSFCLSLKS